MADRSGKALPIQALYCSQADYSQICRVTVETIDAPATPMIHQMSRFWLFTGGRGTVVLQDRQYKVGPGSLVSVLPWQISDVPVVEEPLQYYLLTYYFDNVNMAVKALGQAGRTPLRLMEDMAAAPGCSVRPVKRRSCGSSWSGCGRRPTVRRAILWESCTSPTSWRRW